MHNSMTSLATHSCTAHQMEIFAQEFESASYFCDCTLESVIDVGQGISVGPGKFDKKNKRRALNTHVLCSK